jgi:hypothetical protein
MPAFSVTFGFTRAQKYQGIVEPGSGNFDRETGIRSDVRQMGGDAYGGASAA